jgi:hypothetical protein
VVRLSNHERTTSAGIRQPLSGALFQERAHVGHHRELRPFLGRGPAHVRDLGLQEGEDAGVEADAVDEEQEAALIAGAVSAPLQVRVEDRRHFALDAQLLPQLTEDGVVRPLAGVDPAADPRPEAVGVADEQQAPVLGNHRRTGDHQRVRPEVVRVPRGQRPFEVGH